MRTGKQGAQQPNYLFTVRRQAKGVEVSAKSSRRCWVYGSDGPNWSWIQEWRDKTNHTTIPQNIIFDNKRAEQGAVGVDSHKAVAEVEVEVEVEVKTEGERLQ